MMYNVIHILFINSYFNLNTKQIECEYKLLILEQIIKTAYGKKFIAGVI